MPLFTPIGGGGIGKATVTSTTGSPTVDTTSRPGKTIYKFTSSGTITIGTEGNVEALIVGGGGAGAQAGGGAGGYLYFASTYLPAGSHTVTVGAGGLSSNGIGGQAANQADNGGSSRLGPYVAVGGGASCDTAGMTKGRSGGSGGGASYYFSSGTPGSGQVGQGNDGGYANSSNQGGGGGAGGAGGTPGGGAGVANSITGTSVTYAAGGAGNTNAAGAANTGNGASSNGGNAAGGSGVVIVVVG